MKLQISEAEEGGPQMVTLSRRNLLALLHKLDMPGSFPMLITDYDLAPWADARRSQRI